MLSLADRAVAMPANLWEAAANIDDEERQRLSFEMSGGARTAQDLADQDQRLDEIERRAQMMARAAANLWAAAAGRDGLLQLSKTVHFIARVDDPNEEIAVYTIDADNAAMAALGPGVVVERLLNCRALCVARPGLTQFVPAHVKDTCDNVNLALGAPDASNISSTTFTSGPGDPTGEILTLFWESLVTSNNTGERRCKCTHPLHTHHSACGHTHMISKSETKAHNPRTRSSGYRTDNGAKHKERTTDRRKMH
eukprot:3495278-Prymnesium_polylepis.1